jgi:IclR family KDG regulon transcriptional repressor
VQEYKTLRDFARIVQLFGTFESEEKSVADISKAVKMLPSKVSRILGTIEKEGFLEKNPETKRYRLGIRFFELGMVYAYHLPLRRIIRPHIEQMAKELNLIVGWAILRNNRLIVMDRIQSMTIDILAQRIGLNLPVYCTAVGRLLLAFLPEDEQDRVLESVDLKRLTVATVIERDLIKENLKMIKEKGYATDVGETFEGVNGIAAPIKDVNGEVVAGIHLMGRDSEDSAREIIEFVPYLKEKALFVSRQLGCTRF